MTHVPSQGFCTCGHEMQTERMGLVLEAITEDGPYYKIRADKCTCPDCGHSYYKTAGVPLVFVHEPQYGNVKVDDRVYFADVAKSRTNFVAALRETDRFIP